MPLGIVPDDVFEKELGRSVPTEVKIVEIEKGRGQDNNEVPNSLREIIGEESVINGRKEALELARNFGISPSSVSAYANGSTSTRTYDKQPNLSKLNNARLRVSDRARKRLLKALSAMDETKLNDSSAVELASVAKSMSGIIKDMEPSQPLSPNGNGNNGATYIFYAPQVRDEKHYDVIRVNE